jgi:hypothetical protein
MTGETYAILAYAVGLGLMIAYSARLLASRCSLHRREGLAAARKAPALTPPRTEPPVIVAGLGNVRAAGKVGRHAGHL